MRNSSKKKHQSRLDRSYANYVKRYKAKEKMLKRKGYTMASKMIKSKKMYKAVREAYVEEGQKININQTIVSDQAYEYNQKTARRFKATAEKYGLEWSNKTITQLRKGEIDVSTINDILKEEYPDWTGKDRAAYISHEVFGSD